MNKKKYELDINNIKCPKYHVKTDSCKKCPINNDCEDYQNGIDLINPKDSLQKAREELRNTFQKESGISLFHFQNNNNFDEYDMWLEDRDINHEQALKEQEKKHEKELAEVRQGALVLRKRKIDYQAKWHTWENKHDKLKEKIVEIEKDEMRKICKEMCNVEIKFTDCPACEDMIKFKKKVKQIQELNGNKKNKRV